MKKEINEILFQMQCGFICVGEASSELLDLLNYADKPVMVIEDKDIATVEALHDLLLDNHGYSKDFVTLKRARELTLKMYQNSDKRAKIKK